MSENPAEETAYEGKKEEDMGFYKELFSAKSMIDGQDGGAVTAMLIAAMGKGMLDAAVVVQRKKGYSAEALIVENVEEIFAARGTTYLKVRTAARLQDFKLHAKKRIAVVCTPCNARVARRIQQVLKHNVPSKEIIVIGLFCMEAFNYAKLKVETQKILGIDIDDVERTQIRKGKFTAHIKGREFSCKIKDLSVAVEEGCHYCDDFSARFADISVGSAGSQIGYSTVIVRSDIGKSLLKEFEITKENAEKDEIVKLCKLKKDRALRNLAALRNKKDSKNDA